MSIIFGLIHNHFLAQDVFSKLPACFLAIANVVNEMSVFDAPNYELLHEALSKLAIENQVILTLL